MISRSEIVETARACLGTPFHHQGRMPGVGLDCVGLVVVVAKKLEAAYTDMRAYSMRPDGKTLLEMLRFNSCLQELSSPDAAQSGDVLVFQFIGPVWPQHVGIRTDKGMIHTYTALKRVVEEPYSDVWRGRATHAFQFMGAF